MTYKERRGEEVIQSEERRREQRRERGIGDWMRGKKQHGAEKR